MIVEGEDEDPQNINIPKVEGHHEGEVLHIENLDITVPLKTRKVNIGTDMKPKFVKIGDYWDDATVDKVVELLCKYRDLLPTKFSDLKCIIGDFRVMKVTLKLTVKPVKMRSYCLNPKYKEKVHLELENMLEVCIIKPMEESNWVSPIVVQEKKQKGEIRIYMDLRKLNNACVHDPFLKSFNDEVLENVGE